MATCKRSYYTETRVVPMGELKQIRDQLKRGEIGSSAGLALISALTCSMFQSAFMTALGIGAGMFDLTYKNYMSASNVAQNILDSNNPVTLRLEYRCNTKQRDCYCEVVSLKQV